MFLPKHIDPVHISTNRRFFSEVLPNGTRADAGSGVAPAMFHSVRAPSVVLRPAFDRDHSWSAPTARQLLPPTTGLVGVPPARAVRQSTGPGFDAVSPRSAAPPLSVRVPRLRQSAAIPV